MERRVGGGKGAISATPTRPPRPDFGLDAFESRLRAAFLPQGEAALFFSTTDGIPRQWYRDPSGQN